MMKISELEPAYEAARTWALHPLSHPPSGWAQILRGGIPAWMQERHPSRASQSPEPLSERPGCSPMLTIVAAMIAEVCQ
jgi:hypothetical protein